MNIINISHPIVLLLLVLTTGLLIFLGRMFKKSYIPAIGLGVYLILAVIYTVQLMSLTEALETYRPVLLNCIAIDCVFIFVSFFGYLWIDDIVCALKKKKNLDNSLDWLWNDLNGIKKDK